MAKQGAFNDIDAAIAELFTGRANSTTAIVTLQWLAAHRPGLRARWLAGVPEPA